jgi:hypothetical protein
MMAQKGKPLQIPGEDPRPHARWPKAAARAALANVNASRASKAAARTASALEGSGDKPRFEDKPRRAAAATRR